LVSFNGRAKAICNEAKMSIKELLNSYEFDPEFIYEGLKHDLAEQLKELMESKGISKKELAERMGVSPSYITRIFGADNISLKTVAKVLAALEVNGRISLTPSKREG
jgi:DNA-binding Xre family transcriptional regulator